MLGKLAYQIFFKPLSEWKAIQKKGGFKNAQLIEANRKEMEMAANSLSVSPSYSGALQIHFLTGKKFWYQTAFCAYSLSKVCNVPLQFVFHDDGTFDINLKKQVSSQFPGSIIKDIASINEKLATHLPPSKYPFLHHKRKVYPHIRKLTDVHSGESGWKLLLDSDMLFFKTPHQMIDWLQHPINPFLILDAINSYHYSFNLMESLATKKIAPYLNVGAIGLRSETIDWDKIEYWAKTMEAKEGSSYYLEQALSAMIVAGQSLTLGDKEEYVVLPLKEEVLQPTKTLHHYVAESKEWYFKTGWRNIL